MHIRTAISLPFTIKFYHKSELTLKNIQLTLMRRVTYFIALGPVYTKRQRLRCKNSAMTLQKGFVTHFQVSPLISMRTESLMSSQSDRSVGADAWCKQALRVNLY